MITSAMVCSCKLKLADRFINKQVMDIKELTKVFGPKCPFVSCVIKYH